MAISFISQITANKFLPSANPINMTVNSNNNGKCNFRYVCDVYINDINVFRFKLFPDPNTGYGFFQLADVINDYLKEFMPITNIAGVSIGTDTGSNPNKSMAKVYCKFGEEYDSSINCDSQVDIYPNLNTSNTFYAFYGAIDYKDWPTFNTTGWTEYVTDHAYNPSATPIKFLTNRPRGSVDCTYNDNYYLDYLCSTGVNSDVKLKIRLNGDNLQTYSISLSGFPNNTRMRITCGPNDINRRYGDSIINSTTKYYEVWLDNEPALTVPVRLTEIFKINVIKPKTYRTRIGFIGLLGSIEYVTFYHRDIARMEIDRKNFKNYLTSKKGNTWSYNVGDREWETYATTASEKHNVTSFVSKEESQWLYEMWLSTNVWIEDKPNITSFQIYREDSTPTSRMLLRLPPNQTINASTVFLIPDNQPNFGIYTNRYTVQSIDDNKLDLGFTYNNYSVEACGFIVDNENTRRLPIVVDDNSVVIQQKAGGLIQYSLQYTTSVDKITLRG